jgi:hypothetical protein
MPTDEAFKQQIYEANIAVHRKEAQYYEFIHPKCMANRNNAASPNPSNLDGAITDNHKKAIRHWRGLG